MITVDNDSKVLQIKLAGAVTTNELDWNVTYFSGGAGSNSFDGTTDGTTLVTLCPGTTLSNLNSAVISFRQVALINIFNSDTVDAQVSVIYKNGASSRILVKTLLAVGYTLAYEEHEGWYTIDDTGARVEVVITNNITSIAIGDTVTGASIDQILYVDGAGTLQQIILGTNLALAGSTLNASGGGSQTLAQTLVLGNVTGGTDLVVSGGDLLQFNGATSGVISITTNTNAGTWTLTLPVDDGTPGQVLSTDGSGVTSWITGGTGTVTIVSVVTNQGVSGSVATDTTTPAITLSLGALTGVTSFNGLIITPDTGTITTGVWNGTAIADGNLAVSYIKADGTRPLTGNWAGGAFYTFANNAGSAAISVASAAGTTTLTNISERQQILTGVTTQTFKLPDATTLKVGFEYEFNNNSTGILTVVDNASGAVCTVPSLGYVKVVCTNIGSAAGTWDKHYFIPATGVVPITLGGTGQITAVLGFNALSPVTTRGDIIVRGATNNDRLALGTAGKILRSDGTDLVYTTATYPTTVTDTQIMVATAGNVWGTYSNLTYDGNLFSASGSANATGTVGIYTQNNTSGTAAACSLFVKSTTLTFIVRQYSAGFTTAGLLVADLSRITSNTTVGMLTDITSGKMKWAIGGTATGNEIFRATTVGLNIMGLADPTAFLDLGASVAGTASLRLRAGVDVTTPNDGELWYINTNDRLMFMKNATKCEILSASAETAEVVVSDATWTVTFNGVTRKILIKQ